MAEKKKSPKNNPEVKPDNTNKTKKNKTEVPPKTSTAIREF